MAKKLPKYQDTSETTEVAKELELPTAGGKDYRPTQEILRSQGVQQLKPKEPSLGFKAKWAVEENAPKVASSLGKNAKGFLSWIGEEAKVVGGNIQKGLKDFSEKRQAEYAAEQAGKKRAPAAETPEVSEMEPEEIEDVSEPPVRLSHKPRTKRTFSIHKEGDLVTMSKEDLNSILLEAVKHGKLHKGNVKVKFNSSKLKTPKLRPFEWLSKP